MTNIFTRIFGRTFSSSTMALDSAAGSAATSASSDGVRLTGNLQKATVAAGCFWGVEHAYRHAFSTSQIPELRVGYIGGATTASSPGYRAVCTGTTGHAEGLQMSFNPEQISYGQILEFFFKMHDPTTVDRQGPDRGSQYRSAIFAHGQEQLETARETTRKVSEQWWKDPGQKVVTEVVDADAEGLKWWDAEKYHQKYLDNNPSGYECPSHFIRKFPDLK